MSNEPLKINIGAGKTFIPGFTNVDISTRADVSLDLNHEPLPFEDNSAALVFTNHTLEHLHEYLFALGEIHRVLCHGGQLLVGVPYVTLTEFNLVNPYHKQHFNEYSFDFFDPDRLLGSAAEENAIMFRKVCHRFLFLPEFANEPPEKKEWYRRHCFNVVREIVFGVFAIKSLNEPLTVTDAVAKEMMATYDECMQARTPYSDEEQ